jgi:cation transport ATPase
MPHSARVAHHIHGRLRLHVADAKGSPRILNDIGKAIRQVPGVKDCRINESSASVVVHYDPNHKHQLEFKNQVVTVGNESGLFQITETEMPDLEGIRQEVRFLAQHSQAASSIIKSFEELNEKIKRLTNNFVDLNVLLPLGLAAVALMTFGIDFGTPIWLTLAIFAFNSFLVLHSPWRFPHAETV